MSIFDPEFRSKRSPGRSDQMIGSEHAVMPLIRRVCKNSMKYDNPVLAEPDRGEELDQRRAIDHVACLGDHPAGREDSRAECSLRRGKGRRKDDFARIVDLGTPGPRQ